MQSIVVLISGSGSNLQAIIDHIEVKQLDVNIALVLSNREDAYGLKRAEKSGIATKVIDHTLFGTRELFDSAMIPEIDAHTPNLIVMAGFMRILSNDFIEHYSGRMINIHPSLLPKYKGLHTHRRVLADKGTQHGATVHYVTAELDAGAAIVQGRVPVLTNDSESSLQERVHRIEHVIYPKVIEWFVQGRLSNRNHQVCFDNKRLDHPVIIDQAKSLH